jgi:UDP-GlcNAc:undecaprenyl-phosphate/decaprenyl-phosphate GlcNAc-1-phosphate transferase
MNYSIRRIYKNIKSSLMESKKHKIAGALFLYQILIISIMFVYAYQYFQYLPDNIPLFYNMPWGISQLAPKIMIFIPIIISVFFTFINFLACIYIYNKGYNPMGTFLAVFTSVTVTLVMLFEMRILYISSTEALTAPYWVKIIAIPLCASLVITLFVIPVVIKFAKKYGFMDDPLTHKHPAMLLTRPIPRAGGLAFFLGVLIPALILLPIFTSQKLIGIFLGALICVLTGLRDDKYDMSPYSRLLLMGLAVLVTVMSGILLIYLPNPFGNAVKLDGFFVQFDLFGETRKIYYLSVIAASIWMFLMMNFMSWANGTDGVYAGLVTITSIVIAITVFITSLPVDPSMAVYIKLSALIAGAAIAMAVFTWPPNKIIWGFGATAPALMIAALSIIGSTKVAVTFLILIIPFIDGIIAIIRRLKNRKLPFWGDREHFHHKLLDDHNWSKQQIAIFYWCTTGILGILAISTSGKSRALTVGMIAILVFLVIAGMNFINPKKKAVKS